MRYHLNLTNDAGGISALGGFDAADDDQAKLQAARDLRWNIDQPGVASATAAILSREHGDTIAKMPVADFLALIA